MKEYTSNIVVTFSINNLEAETKEEYIEKIKDQFSELHGIELMTHEIQDIEEVEANNEKLRWSPRRI